MKKSILEVVHESVEGLYNAGLLDTTTSMNLMRCVTPIESLLEK
jgi:hypothetical protein